MNQLNPLLEGALALAARGWRVIPLHNLSSDGKACTCQEWRDSKKRGPCPSEGKHPRFLNFAKLATTDAKRIRAWWRTYPDANVGLILGAESGIWALDTDPRNNGDWARGELVVKHGEMPYGVKVRTGGGGSHEYFRWPAEFAIPPMLEIDPGLEVVGQDHILVAPPSLHKSGLRYEWDELTDDGAIPDPVDAPAWLIDLIQGRMRGPAEASGGVRGGWPEADIGKILQGCAWMRHCSDDAALLGEPEWYAQLSIIGRCAGALDLAQELSGPHAEYSASATAAKLQHATRDAGPATCAKVRHSLGGARFCDACPNAGRVKSPAVLGIANASGDRRQQRMEPRDEDVPVGRRGAGGKGLQAQSEPSAKPSDAEETVAAAVDRCIAARDTSAVMALAPRLAAESETTVAGLKAKILAQFGRDISMGDLGRAVRSEQRKVAKAVGAPDEWRSLLMRTGSGSGSPKAHLANAVIALRYCPAWKGVLAWNEFAVCVEVRKKAPVDRAAGKREWEGIDDILLADWLQRNDIDVSPQIAGMAVQAVAQDFHYHPVRDYLLGLKWDGEPRLDTWLERYLGARLGDPAAGAPNTTEYLAAVGAKWMISAVARVMQPGCKADCALVLEGPQGKMKSTTADVLGGEWYTDQLEQMGTKDSSMQTHGVWIIEIGELGSMLKAEIDAVKTFMSRKEERYRPPYSPRLVKIKRQCVFVGTVNQGQYLKDETGGRRWWPVRCGHIDIEALRRDRDQLWAEARFRYDEGATWWLDVQEVVERAEEEQGLRFREDAWEGVVGAFLLHGMSDETALDQILGECLGLPTGRWTQADSNRVANILARLGWAKVRKRVGSLRPWVYRPHTTEAKLVASRQIPLQDAAT